MYSTFYTEKYRLTVLLTFTKCDLFSLTGPVPLPSDKFVLSKNRCAECLKQEIIKVMAAIIKSLVTQDQ